MESQTEVLGMVSQLSVLNAKLLKEINTLEEGRRNLDQRFNSNLSSLNQAIRELPTVINVFLLEKPPPLRLTFAGRLLLALGSSQPTLSTVHTVISNICEVESDMRDSQEEASAKKLDTADLASQAAEHVELCSSVLTKVSNAKTETQASLDTVSRRISYAQQEINDNNRLSADMADKARRHDENAEGNKVLFWATFWIPVVNVFTIPVSLLLNQENKDLAASCRNMVTRLNTEVQQKSSEKLRMEAASHELDEVLEKLRSAGEEAEETAVRSSGLVDQAKALVDKYNLITTRIRDVLQALDHLQGDVSAEIWDLVRFTALQALKGMIGTLRERDLLASECLPVVNMIENVPGLEEWSGKLLEELEW